MGRSERAMRPCRVRQGTGRSAARQTSSATAGRQEGGPGTRGAPWHCPSSRTPAWSSLTGLWTYTMRWDTTLRHAQAIHGRSRVRVRIAKPPTRVRASG